MNYVNFDIEEEITPLKRFKKKSLNTNPSVGATLSKSTDSYKSLPKQLKRKIPMLSSASSSTLQETSSRSQLENENKDPEHTSAVSANQTNDTCTVLSNPTAHNNLTTQEKNSNTPRLSETLHEEIICSKTQSHIESYFHFKNERSRKSPKVTPQNSVQTNESKQAVRPNKQIVTVGNNSKHNKPAKQCPFYKKIPGTTITVDAFRYGDIPGCTCYFLSHFHADHYGGLTKRFNGTIYCSTVTANLIISELGVNESIVRKLPMNKEVKVNDVMVTLLDANHCPGAVMFYFLLPNHQRILHVGDFRADASKMATSSTLLKAYRLNTLYLDTTYCDSKYSFPPQKDTIHFVRHVVGLFLKKYPKTLICVGAYTIGKERVFKAIARELSINKIAVSKRKHKVLKCIEDKDLVDTLTTNPDETNLHVIPMAWLNIKKLHDYYKEFNKDNNYDKLLAIKPTGWSFSNNNSSLDDIKPVERGVVTVYGIPYSEHSSHAELEWFVKWLRPAKIIPTVNNGSKPSRDKMESYFREWLS